MNKILPLAFVFIVSCKSTNSTSDQKNLGPGNVAADKNVCNLKNALGMVFCPIPKGDFVMGASTDDKSVFDDDAQHPVTITKDFEMMAFEVNQTMWHDVTGEAPSYFRDRKYCPNFFDDTKKICINFLVESISWDVIKQNFLPKLNARLNDGYTYRLPTEAEWEFAARGGTTGSFGIEGELDTFAWYENNSGNKTHAV